CASSCQANPASLRRLPWHRRSCLYPVTCSGGSFDARLFFFLSPWAVGYKATTPPVCSRAMRGVCFCFLAFEKINQMRLGQFDLFARRQRLQRPLAARHFIIAENQRVTRTQFVCLAQRFAEFLLRRRKLDAETSRSQILRRANGRSVSFLAHPGDIHVAPLRRGRFTGFLQREDQEIGRAHV